MDGLITRRLARLAPTPSGYLHAGNAINFIITARMAEWTGARLMLRIDDLDFERVRPAYVDDIFRSLEWLGIHYDVGPDGPDDLERSWSQRLRLSTYQDLLDRLRAKGHVYACSCSRRDIRAGGHEGGYPGTCRERGLDLEAPEVAWRLRIPDGTVVSVPGLFEGAAAVRSSEELGDPVVRQRNGRPAYQVASLADDERYGVDLVVRGEDLLPSSACQLYMASLLELEAFRQVRFLHHGLLRAKDGSKLSKSEGAEALRSMRKAGLPPEALWEQADRVLEAMNSTPGRSEP